MKCSTFILIIAAVLGRQVSGFEDTNYGNVHKSSDYYNSHKEGKHAASTTQEEDVFYFFGLHDYNKDGKLDGCELGLAFQGYEHLKDGSEQLDLIPQRDLEYLIDHALMEDDTDNDGYLSWEEYLASQQYHHQMQPRST